MIVYCIVTEIRRADSALRYEGHGRGYRGRQVTPCRWPRRHRGGQYRPDRRHQPGSCRPQVSSLCSLQQCKQSEDNPRSASAVSRFIYNHLLVLLPVVIDFRHVKCLTPNTPRP